MNQGNPESFSFVTIAYNHEEIILEHLESIKYQIIHFGKNREIDFIFSDDGSSDRTLKRVRGWLKMNPALFRESCIIAHECNQGIVANYRSALARVRTNQFKLLSGDDLYFKHDIFDAVKGWDLVFTPVIFFNHSNRRRLGVVNYTIYSFDSFEKIRNLLRIKNFIAAPGTFISNRVGLDKKMLEFVAGFKWVEDFTKWLYVFNHYEELSYRIDALPLVLYRNDVGISKDKKHSKSKEFREEVRRIAKEFDIKAYREPKLINPYRYLYKLWEMRINWVDPWFNPRLIRIRRLMKEELAAVPEFLEMIAANARESQGVMEEE